MCKDCHVDIAMPYLSWLGVAVTLEHEHVALCREIRSQLRIPTRSYTTIPLAFTLDQWMTAIRRLRQSQSPTGRFCGDVLNQKLLEVYANPEQKWIREPIATHTPVKSRVYRKAHA